MGFHVSLGECTPYDPRSAETQNHTPGLLQGPGKTKPQKRVWCHFVYRELLQSMGTCQQRPAIVSSPHTGAGRKTEIYCYKQTWSSMFGRN